MAFTYGCYNYDANDLNPKLYDAVQISRIFDGIITDGVYARVGNCFAVRAVTNTPNMVIVSSGRAWFNHTWNYNDSDMYSGIHFDEMPVSPTFNDRIDALVIDVNSSRSVRENKLTWHMGEEAETPTKPTLINDSAAGHYEHAIAYITRHASGDGYIESSDIERVVGTTETPYVTGILQQLDATQLLAGIESDFENMLSDWGSQVQSELTRWNRQVQEFLSTSDSEYTAWFNNAKSSFEMQMEFFLSDFDSFMTSSGTRVDDLISDFTSAFNTWFNAFKTTSTGSVDDLINSLTSTFNTWFNGVKSDYNTWFNAIKADYNSWYSSTKTDYNSWYDGTKTAYNAWFNSLTPTIKTATISNGSVTFSDIPSSNNYYIEFFCEVPDVDYLNTTVSGTNVTLTYDPTYNGTKVYCRISEVVSK